MPPVRLAPREELAAAARVAPLLRAARDLTRWARAPATLAGHPAAPSARCAVRGAGHRRGGRPGDGARRSATRHGSGGRDQAAGPATAQPGMAEGTPAGAGAWDGALRRFSPPRISTGWPPRCTRSARRYGWKASSMPTPRRRAPSGTWTARPTVTWPRPTPSSDEDQGAALSRALETLADLGVVELGTEEAAGGLTVALSPLGIWGVHRRLRAPGLARAGARRAGPGRGGRPAGHPGQLRCRGRRGRDRRVARRARTRGQAAAELIDAAAGGSPGLRGAAFAVLDRIGASRDRRGQGRARRPAAARARRRVAARARRGSRARPG